MHNAWRERFSRSFEFSKRNRTPFFPFFSRTGKAITREEERSSTRWKNCVAGIWNGGERDVEGDGGSTSVRRIDTLAEPIDSSRATRWPRVGQLRIEISSQGWRTGFGHVQRCEYLASFLPTVPYKLSYKFLESHQILSFY